MYHLGSLKTKIWNFQFKFQIRTKQTDNIIIDPFGQTYPLPIFRPQKK